MTSVENHLKGLAARVAEKLKHRADIANCALPRARQILEEVRAAHDAATLAALRAPSHSPVHKIAHQRGEDLAIALANVSSLELKHERAVAGQLRVETYVPRNDRGSYSCPQCWVEENVIVAMSMYVQASAGDVFECPTCAYKFTCIHDSLPRRDAAEVNVAAKNASQEIGSPPTS